MSQTRRLAAILAADVAGYSRLMGADEEGTHERLQAHLRELVEPKITDHRGRIVKNTGDGMLAEFASVVDAVRCAVEVQRAMVDREPEVAEERRIKFRIGINLGDVIVEEHDIFGDGVNIAARLEGLAPSGGICVSGTVRDHIGDRLAYVAAAAASAVLEVGPPLPALTLMALLGSLGFARWIMTAGRRPGGAVALTGLVTFGMLFGLTASPTSFEVPVLDRIVDIFVLSLYTVGATTLLLPSPDPMAGHGGPLGGQFA